MNTTVLSELSEEAADPHKTGGKYLSFNLGKEVYAIGILKIQEIIGLIPITPVPDMPTYVRGLINLRGKIIPIIDLRLRFGLPKVEDTDESCIIVVQHEDLLTGLLVDKVSEVTDIAGELIDDTAVFGLTGKSKYLSGIGKVGTTVNMIVDVHETIYSVADSVIRPHSDNWHMEVT